MQISDVIAALTALNDPDAEVAIGGVDHLVIEKIPAGWSGHVPPTMTHRYEINTPPPVDALEAGMAKLRSGE
jgi:hypothetical protein